MRLLFILIPIALYGQGGYTPPPGTGGGGGGGSVGAHGAVQAAGATSGSFQDSGCTNPSSGNVSCAVFSATGAGAGEVDIYDTAGTHYFGVIGPSSFVSNYKSNPPSSPPTGAGQTRITGTNVGNVWPDSWGNVCQIAYTGVYSGLPAAGSGNSGQCAIVTDTNSGCTAGGGSATIQWYSNGSSWACMGGGGSSMVYPAITLPISSGSAWLYSAPSAQSWTTYGGAGSNITPTVTSVDGEVYVTLTYSTGTADTWGKYVTVSGNWTHTLTIIPTGIDINQNDQFVGVFATDGTRYESCSIRALAQNGYWFENHANATYNGSGSGPSVVSGGPVGKYMIPWISFQMAYSSGSLSCNISFDGVGFQPEYAAHTLGWTPTGFGYIFGPQGAATGRTDSFSVIGYN